MKKKFFVPARSATTLRAAITMLAILLSSLLAMLYFPGSQAAAKPSSLLMAEPTQSHTFATFNTGVITGGGAAFSLALDVSSLPAADYLFYNVTADYIPSAAPNDAWSSTMQMALTNGGATAYRPAGGATIGVLPAGGSTALIWTGQMVRAYPGASSLTISFQHVDDALGTYTLQLQNVSVTIYPAPTPRHTFATFNTGTITGGGSAFSLALDVFQPARQRITCSTPLPPSFLPGAAPNDAWSEHHADGADQRRDDRLPTGRQRDCGVYQFGQHNPHLDGQMVRPYSGGTSLTISFQDTFDDALGTYTSN